MPTAIPMPCPNGPVVASTPGVTLYSGWPGVLESICLKFFKSSKVKSYPAKYNVAYNKAEPWPADITNLSRLKKLGSEGSILKWWA